MANSEVHAVLANWIRQTQSGDGVLPGDTDAAMWVGDRFLKWWHSVVADDLSDALGAAARLRSESERLGGWSRKEFGETMHELTHVEEALASLEMKLKPPMHD
jgi:hypothetical protein